MNLQISYILFTCIIFAPGISGNCADFKGARPRIKIHSFGPIQFIPTESLENTNGTVDFQLKPMDCSHTSPIELIVNIDPITNPFEIRRTFFSRNLTFDSSVNSISDNASSVYTIYFVFLYKPRVFKNPVLFLCKPIDQVDECSRTFLEITPAKYSANFFPTDKPSSKIFQELSENLLNQSILENNSNSTFCKLKLFIKAIGNRLEYKWEGDKLLTERAIVTNQIIYLDGLFRNVKQEKNCVKLLEMDELCQDCKMVSDPIINSIAFYAKSEETEMVFKGFFNLSSNPSGARRLYLDWEVSLLEMISLNVPAIAYVDKSVKIACSVSIFYFAFGTVLTTDENFRDICSGEREVYKDDGRREVFRNFTFSEGNKFVNLSCFAPLWNSTERISKFKTIFIDYPERPSINGSFENILEKLVTEKDATNLTISCKSIGKPLPTLEWKLPNPNIKDKLVFMKQEDINFIQLDITIPVLQQDFLGTYKCISTNYLGSVEKSYDIQIPIEGLSKGAKAGIGSGLGILVLIFVAIIFLIYRKIILQRQEYRTKTAEAIQEFKEGISRKDDKTNDHHFSILEQPYNDDYELAFEMWTIDDKLLGQGAFGIVRSGCVKIGNKSQVVAIKMLKSSVEIEDFKSFLTELKLMAYIFADGDDHPNIVKLVAACTQNIDQRDVMIGVEFCSNGNLLEYLQKSLFQTSENVPVPTVQPTGTYANLANPVSLTEIDLYSFAYQIASGMDCLSTKKILHMDLACRNVLLTSDKTAKISDFGLSRVLIDSSNYTKKSKVALPWKWMAIECLKSLNFSSASDVWAYGVTIWEVFSLGEAPYAGLHFNRNFITQLEEGLRLGKPARASDLTYNLMKQCWNEVPNQRLTFLQLKSAFSEILGSFSNLSSTNELTESNLVFKQTTDPEPNPDSQILALQEVYRNVPRSSNLYLNY